MGLSWPWRVLGSRVFVYGVMVREGDDIVKVARAVDSAAIMEYSGVSACSGLVYGEDDGMG
ncbi:hypothetical protein GYH30_026493 [Glycine max]|nr:hypothetical protein GYH30_026493 [Glycine max]